MNHQNKFQTFSIFFRFCILLIILWVGSILTWNIDTCHFVLAIYKLLSLLSGPENKGSKLLIVPTGRKLESV